MAINTTAGATVSIGPATTATTEAALSALTYVAVGKVESLGEIGPQAQDVTFQPISGDDVQHLKGATDNGSITITCGRDPLDVGQLALKAASRTKLQYAIKIVVPDAADETDTDSVFYIRGPVMGGRTNLGGANDVTKVTYNIGNNVFIEVPSEAVP